GGIADPRPAPCLSGIPHVIAVAVLEDDRAVQVIFPIGLLVGTKDDHRLAPLDAILAFDQGDAFLVSPGEPHAVDVALLQNRDVEAGSEVAAKNGVLLVFDPSGSRLGERRVRFIGADNGQQEWPNQEYDQRLHRWLRRLPLVRRINIPPNTISLDIGTSGHDEASWAAKRIG